MGIEIERKFLVCNEERILENRPFTPIAQGYITDIPDRIVRVRLAGKKGFLTLKGRTHGCSRLEFEYPIPPDDARRMLTDLCIRPLVEKERFTIEHQRLSWTVDRFLGRNQGLVVAEIELEEENQKIPIPPWIGREVTHDPRYYNSNLIKAPFDTWEPDP